MSPDGSDARLGRSQLNEQRTRAFVVSTRTLELAPEVAHPELADVYRRKATLQHILDRRQPGLRRELRIASREESVDLAAERHVSEIPDRSARTHRFDRADDAGARVT